MKWTAYTRKTTKAGTATVEFAIVMPLLVVLLFSIIEFGFIFKDQLTLQQAAREGVRIAAVGKTTPEIQARVFGSAATLDPAKFASGDPQMDYREYTSSGWGPWTQLGNQVTTTYTNDAPQGAQVRVRLTYTHDLLTGPLFARLIGKPGASSLTLHAQMVMRRE